MRGSAGPTFCYLLPFSPPVPGASGLRTDRNFCASPAPFWLAAPIRIKNDDPNDEGEAGIWGEIGATIRL